MIDTHAPCTSMPERLHLVLERSDKERYRRAAQRQGKTLSEWLREAAEEKLASGEERSRLGDAAGLEAFFTECDRQAGEGREPDWDEHVERIAESRRRGLPPA
jgi:hypothetical protein